MGHDTRRSFEIAKLCLLRKVLFRFVRTCLQAGSIRFDHIKAQISASAYQGQLIANSIESMNGKIVSLYLTDGVLRTIVVTGSENLRQLSPRKLLVTS